jgi:hypothetical protein
MPKSLLPDSIPKPTMPRRPKQPKPLNRIESAFKNIERQDLIHQLRTATQNKANNPHRLVTHNDTTLTLSDWAKHLGVPYNTLKSRYDQGKRGEQLLSTVTHIQHTFNNDLEQT